MHECATFVGVVLLVLALHGCSSPTAESDTQPTTTAVRTESTTTITADADRTPASTTAAPTTTSTTAAPVTSTTTTSVPLEELPVPDDALAQLAKIVGETIGVPQRSFELNSTRILDAGATETLVLRVGRFDETTQTGEGALRNAADGEVMTVEQRRVLGEEHWFGNGSTDPVQWTGMSLVTALDLADYDVIGEMSGDYYLRLLLDATTGVERVSLAPDASERWTLSVEADRMLDVFAASDSSATFMRARGANNTGIRLVLTAVITDGRITSVEGDFSPWWREAYAKLVAGSLRANPDGNEIGRLVLTFAPVDGPVVVERPCDNPIAARANDAIDVLIC